MSHKFAEIAFTPTVKALQEQFGSRTGYARLEGSDADRNQILRPNEAGFIAQRDSFYMASVSETGWPYIQHRGGPEGFVRVLDQTTIGFGWMLSQYKIVSSIVMPIHVAYYEFSFEDDRFGCHGASTTSQD